MSKWYNKQLSLLLWRPKKRVYLAVFQKQIYQIVEWNSKKKNHKYKKNILKKSANRQNNNKPNCVCCYIVSIWDTKILIFLNRCAATTTSELCIYSVYSIIRADNYGQDETSAAIGMTIQKKSTKIYYVIQQKRQNVIFVCLNKCCFLPLRLSRGNSR